MIWHRVKFYALKDVLLAESSGILAHFVRGCLAWQKNGTAPPENVLAATDRYRAEQDPLAMFIESECVLATNVRCKSGQLYDAYVEFQRHAGEQAISLKKFGEAIAAREIESTRSNGIWYLSIGLRRNS